MIDSAQPQASADGVHLRAEPAHTSVDVIPGKFAVISVHLSIEGTPRPLKGHPTVRVGDPAFEVAGITEKRRVERAIELEVHGRFRDTRPRDIKLRYEVDGLTVEQFITFVPSSSVVAANSPVTHATHIDGARDGSPVPALARTTPAAPAATPRGSARAPLQRDFRLNIAPAPQRLLAAILDLLIASVLASASAFAFAVTAAIIVGLPCGFEEMTPGTGCYYAEQTWAWTAVSWWLVGVPLYHLVTNIVGRSIGKRVCGLRVICTTAKDQPEPQSPDRRPGIWRGLCRTVVAYLGAACLALGYLSMFANPDRRAWHDLASGTIVVRQMG
jgi:uncharacterized RDD family membrane protein YckC